MLTIYTIFLFVVCFLALLYVPSFKLKEHKFLMPIGLVVKLLAGWFFYYVYSLHYGAGQLTADAGQFLQESTLLSNVFWESPGDYFRFLFNIEDHAMVMHYLSETTHWDAGPMAILNDSKNLIKLHSILNFISFGLPEIHILFSCFLSFFGVFHLTKAFKRFVVIKTEWLFFLILLAPSTLFWTSGLLKEPFLFFGIGLFCRGLLCLEDSKRKRAIYIIIGALFLIGFKPYTLICILAAILIYLLFVQVKSRVLAFGIIGILIVTLASYIFLSENNSVVKTLSAKQSDFIGISKGGTFIRNDSCFFIFNDNQMNLFRIEDSTYYLTKSVAVEYVFPYTKNEPQKTIAHPNKEPWWFGYKYVQCGSYIPLHYIDNSSKNLFKNIPSAMVNSTLRPFINDPGSNFKYLATAETWIMLVFFGVILFYKRNLNSKEFAMIMALLTFSVLMLLLVGWITPVLGAIVRYRFSAYLAIGLIGLILIPEKKNKAL